VFDLEQNHFNGEIFIVDREHEFSSPPGSSRWIGIDDKQIDDATLRSDIQTLQKLGVENATAYAEAVQHGNKLLVVQANGKQIFHIYDIMSQSDSKVASEH
jgi:hypothetical protein